MVPQTLFYYKTFFRRHRIGAKNNCLWTLVWFKLVNNKQE